MTVGVSQGFRRLVEGADQIAAAHPEDFLIQLGETDYHPENADSVDILPPKEHNNLFREATLVVGHAGTGTLLTAMQNDTRLVLFPRNSECDEVFDDHQIHHVNGWSDQLNLTVTHSIEDLESVVHSPEKVPNLSDEMSGELTESIGQIIKEEVNNGGGRI
ncbi:glycosyltransferase [Natrinema hispanicum]|uniref:glycosyltransferase n=1 Tax=Natrinema hispanicum TaxID=392421 RepID=UPI00165F95D7|nr:glycosyltransferase [Natrinema hispanicum]